MSYSIPKADGHRFSSRISPILFPISFIIVLVTTVIICCVCEDEYEEVKKHDPTPLQKNDNYDPDDKNKGGFGWGIRHQAKRQSGIRLGHRSDKLLLR